MLRQQSTDGKNKIFVALMDADGCFYNVVFDVLLRYLIAEHGNAIFLGDDPDNNKAAIDRVLECISSIGGLFLERYVRENTLTISPALNEKVIANNASFIVANFGDVADSVSDEAKIAAIKRSFIFDLRQTELGREIYQALLLVANQQWVAHVEGRVKADLYQTLLFMSGSNRQSYHREYANSVNNGTGYFIVDLLPISSAFKESINHENDKPIKCHVEPFLLADLYADKHAGHSLGFIVHESNNVFNDDVESITHNDYVFDETKFTLIYAAAYHLATKYPDKLITMAFYDDRDDIQNALIAVLKDNKDLLLDNISIEFWPYDGKMADQPLDVITGTSKLVDFQFRDNVKRIIELCGGSLEDVGRTTIDIANIFLQDETGSLLQQFKALRHSSNPALYEFGSLSDNALTLFAVPSAPSVAAAAAAAVTTTLPAHQVGSSSAQDQQDHPAPDVPRTPSPRGQ